MEGQCNSKRGVPTEGPLVWDRHLEVTKKSAASLLGLLFATERASDPNRVVKLPKA